MTRYGIALAAPTALYLPLYLAKVTNPNSAFKMIDFVYKKDAAIRAHPHRSSVSDPLLNYLLTEPDNDIEARCILGVCDPFRAFLKPNFTHARPKIAGTLVKHMFFWLIDHDTEVKDADQGRIHDLFERIVVAPRHMTGYAVACYYLLKRCGVDLSNIDNRLYYDTRPGFEAQFCRHFQQSKWSKDYAYLTWDMKNRFRLENGEKVHLPFRDCEEFENCAMTSLIVNEEIYESRHGALIDELIGLTYDAVRVMRNNPDGAAESLKAYADPDIDFADVPLTRKYIAYLNDNEAFVDDRKVDAAHIEKTILIRRQVMDLNPFAGEYELNAHLSDYVIKSSYCDRNKAIADIQKEAILLRWHWEEAHEKNKAHSKDEARGMKWAIGIAFLLVALQCIDLLIAKGLGASRGAEYWREWTVMFGLVLAPVWVVLHDARRLFWGEPLPRGTHTAIGILLVLLVSVALGNLIWRESKVGTSILAALVLAGAFYFVRHKTLLPEEQRRRRREKREQKELAVVLREIEKQRAPHLPDPLFVRLKRRLWVPRCQLAAEPGGADGA